MKLDKRADRKLKASDMLKVYRMSGGSTKHIGQWCKWVELSFGGKRQATLDIYEVSLLEHTAYMVVDELGMIACPLVENLNEVTDYLKEHSYKTDKQWFIEDYGMSEDAWEEWNK